MRLPGFLNSKFPDFKCANAGGVGAIVKQSKSEDACENNVAISRVLVKVPLAPLFGGGRQNGVKVLYWLTARKDAAPIIPEDFCEHPMLVINVWGCCNLDTVDT